MGVRSCSGCGHENLAARKFCSECGAPLASGCPACGVENEPGAKFCGECGAALSATAPAPPAASATSSPPAASSAATASPRSAAGAVPGSFASGRYQVRRFLGEGAKKRVYLASDTKLDLQRGVGGAARPARPGLPRRA